jgi:hypothetical protein
MTVDAPTREELDLVRDAATEAMRVLGAELRKRGLRDPRWRAPGAGAVLAGVLADVAGGDKRALEQLLLMHLETIGGLFPGIVTVEQLQVTTVPQGRPN